jgi:hypothetical protein
LQLAVYAVMLILGLAYGMSWMALVMAPSSAAAAMGPTLCPPDTEAVVRTGGYDERGRWEERATYALHCVSRWGRIERKHDELFWMLWGLRFIPHAALALAVGLPLWLAFGALRQALTRSRPVPAPAPRPIRKPRRSRR